MNYGIGEDERMTIQCPNCKRIFQDSELTGKADYLFNLNDMMKVSGSIMCSCGMVIGYSQYYAPIEDSPNIEYTEPDVSGDIEEVKE